MCLLYTSQVQCVSYALVRIFVSVIYQSRPMWQICITQDLCFSYVSVRPYVALQHQPGPMCRVCHRGPMRQKCWCASRMKWAVGWGGVVRQADVTPLCSTMDEVAMLTWSHTHGYIMDAHDPDLPTGPHLWSITKNSKARHI